MSSSPEPRTEAFLLPVADGFRFCLLHRASNMVPFCGGLLFVQPFAEEMNKSRRAVAVASRELALNGWTVLQIDLSGCGDSSGDSSVARWEDWKDDLLLAAEWMRKQGACVRVLWGLRLGALLASTVVDRISPAPDLLLWQPVLSGKVHLTQFLRLKSAEAMLGGLGQQGVTAQLRKELESGSPVEVAGYALNPELARGIETAELVLPETWSGHVYWLECGPSTQADLSPTSTRLIDSLIASGRSVSASAVGGPSFWQTVEIEEAPALTEATIKLLRLPAADGRRAAA